MDAASVAATNVYVIWLFGCSKEMAVVCFTHLLDQEKKRSLNSLPHNDNFLVAFLCHDNDSATPVGAQISRFCLKVPINSFFLCTRLRWTCFRRVGSYWITSGFQSKTQKLGFTRPSKGCIEDNGLDCVEPEKSLDDMTKTHAWTCLLFVSESTK